MEKRCADYDVCEAPQLAILWTWTVDVAVDIFPEHSEFYHMFRVINKNFNLKMKEKISYMMPTFKTWGSNNKYKNYRLNSSQRHQWA